MRKDQRSDTRPRSRSAGEGILMFDLYIVLPDASSNFGVTLSVCIHKYVDKNSNVTLKATDESNNK